MEITKTSSIGTSARTPRKDERTCNMCSRVYRMTKKHSLTGVCPECFAKPTPTPDYIEQGADAIEVEEAVVHVYGEIGDKHHRIDVGTCACGKFCHTFGKGDDRKLSLHIAREKGKPEVRLTNKKASKAAKLAGQLFTLLVEAESDARDETSAGHLNNAHAAMNLVLDAIQNAEIAENGN